MSFIDSINYQHLKSEFSLRLCKFFLQDEEVSSIFTGATNCLTVCNVISAMIHIPENKASFQNEIELEEVFHCLDECFLLVLIKELDRGGLSQAEKLIMTITAHYAKYICDNDDIDVLIKNKGKVITDTMAHLVSYRKKVRKDSLNMLSN